MIRCIAILFRIILSDRLGAQGVGLYQLIMSVYGVFLTLVTSGISLCTTRVFGEYAAVGEYSKGKYCVEKYIVFSFISGLAAGGLMLSTAELTGAFILKDERTVLPLMLLAPALPLMAVSSCIRGYFFARRKTIQTAGEQLLEQVTEVLCFLTLFIFVEPRNVSEACAMAVIGTTAAEFVSFFYALFFYWYDMRKLCTVSEKTVGLIKKTTAILLPVCANSLTRSGLSAVENILVPFGLNRYGNSRSDSLAAYGTVSGMSMPLYLLPSVPITPFSSLMIAEIAEARVTDRKKDIRRMTERSFGITLCYSIPVMVMFIAFAVPLCRMLYGSDSAGMYLAILAPVIPLTYLDSLVDAILKGMNEQTSYFVFNTIDSAVRVILTFTLLPVFGIAGFLAVIIISELLNSLLSIGRLIRVTSFKIHFIENILRPFICITVPVVFVRLIPQASQSGVGTVISMIFCIVCYLLLLRMTKRYGPEKVRTF